VVGGQLRRDATRDVDDEHVVVERLDMLPEKCNTQTVGGPHRRELHERVMRQPTAAATVRRQKEDVPAAREGDPPPVRRPRPCRSDPQLVHPAAALAETVAARPLSNCTSKTASELRAAAPAGKVSAETRSANATQRPMPIETPSAGSG
jgi:hypothetical protein